MMSKTKISVLQSMVNSNSLNVAYAFSEAGLLHEAITTLGYNPRGAVGKLLKYLPSAISTSLEKELERRLWLLAHSGTLCTHSTRELIRLLLLKTGIHKYFFENRENLTEWIMSDLSVHTAKDHLYEIDAVYTYEDQAEAVFRQAKIENKKCFYDLPSIFYKTRLAIENEEAILFPDLANSFGISQASSLKLEKKEAEVKLADHIFVASTVNRQSLMLAGIDEAKISVIPYGAPTEYFFPKAKPDTTFRALFVGRSSPHKGVHYLLKAWKELSLPNSELMFVGSNMMPKQWFKPYQDICRHIPSIPHTALNSYYSLGSVLVFPSLAEGFGLVITEAMACGIPVITTTNTAGPDIITDGVEGFIIPIRDINALKEKLEWCYEHPKELVEMGKAARLKAEQLTWEKYRTSLTMKVEKLLLSPKDNYECL